MFVEAEGCKTMLVDVMIPAKGDRPMIPAGLPVGDTGVQQCRRKAAGLSCVRDGQEYKQTLWHSCHDPAWYALDPACYAMGQAGRQAGRGRGEGKAGRQEGRGGVYRYEPE